MPPRKPASSLQRAYWLPDPSSGLLSDVHDLSSWAKGKYQESLCGSSRREEMTPNGAGVRRLWRQTQMTELLKHWSGKRRRGDSGECSVYPSVFTRAFYIVDWIWLTKVSSLLSLALYLPIVFRFLKRAGLNNAARTQLDLVQGRGSS